LRGLYAIPADGLALLVEFPDHDFVAAGAVDAVGDLHHPLGAQAAAIAVHGVPAEAALALGASRAGGIERENVADAALPIGPGRLGPGLAGDLVGDDGGCLDRAGERVAPPEEDAAVGLVVPAGQDEGLAVVDGDAAVDGPEALHLTGNHDVAASRGGQEAPSQLAVAEAQGVNVAVVAAHEREPSVDRRGRVDSAARLV
jgi:hypothetical protein